MDSKNIIIFDGYCNFCSRGVDFILQRDSQKIFSFAASQSESGERILASHNIRSVESVIYIRHGNTFQSSSAVLRILQDLGYPWKIFFVFILVPRFIRDAVYNFIAKSRYSLLGRRNVCRIPNENERSRFL
jgi:predicted DCC family thiol-disulfide oxidoreductase YuxK